MVMGLPFFPIRNLHSSATSTAPVRLRTGVGSISLKCQLLRLRKVGGGIGVCRACRVGRGRAQRLWLPSRGVVDGTVRECLLAYARIEIGRPLLEALVVRDAILAGFLMLRHPAIFRHPVGAEQEGIVAVVR